jgi:DNA repair exonuclease SbcCD nuclease subunit
MFKFIHAADVHLDSPLHKLDYYEGAPKDEIRRASRRAFENLVQTAISENVNFILIAGDLYDGDWRDYNTGLYLVAQTARLAAADIPVYIIAGNHDAASKITRKLRLPEKVHLFPSSKPATLTIDDLKVAIHGQSFAKPAVKRDLSANYPDPLPGYFNIGVLHTCVSGRQDHEPYAPCSLEGLRSRGYDYWALGHVHRHEILSAEPPVAFSGCIQGRHIRETGPKGCLFVTVDDHGSAALEFKPLDVIRWAVTEVDTTGTQSGYDVVDRFSARLEPLMDENEGLPLVTRVFLRGETDAHSEILTRFDHWCSEIRSAAIDIGGGRVWVEKVVFHTRPPSSEKDVHRKDDAVGDLLNMFDEITANPDMMNALLEELEGIAKKIPREMLENSESLKLREPGWIEGMLAQVRPMLLQRLLRKGGPP